MLITKYTTINGQQQQQKLPPMTNIARTVNNSRQIAGPIRYQPGIALGDLVDSGDRGLCLANVR